MAVEERKLTTQAGLLPTCPEDLVFPLDGKPTSSPTDGSESKRQGERVSIGEQ